MSDWLDAESHADRALEMYERGRWAEMGRAGRDFVESGFSAAAATRDLLEAYARVAPPGPRG